MIYDSDMSADWMAGFTVGIIATLVFGASLLVLTALLAGKDRK